MLLVFSLEDLPFMHRYSVSLNRHYYTVFRILDGEKSSSLEKGKMLSRIILFDILTYEQIFIYKIEVELMKLENPKDIEQNPVCEVQCVHSDLISTYVNQIITSAQANHLADLFKTGSRGKPKRQEQQPAT
ncbi:MAG: hypothetical protein QMC95_00185 [Desulfitobacteriaceae bacterium]|nr:hypothetical protein [Desulfitobacteriaceae bacterium]MDI6912621.1 hypothetical protein [Desulfitobacteriaceae bacterium]